MFIFLTFSRFSWSRNWYPIVWGFLECIFFWSFLSIYLLFNVFSFWISYYLSRVGPPGISLFSMFPIIFHITLYFFTSFWEISLTLSSNTIFSSPAKFSFLIPSFCFRKDIFGSLTSLSYYSISFLFHGCSHINDNIHCICEESFHLLRCLFTWYKCLFKFVITFVSFFSIFQV